MAKKFSSSIKGIEFLSQLGNYQVSYGELCSLELVIQSLFNVSLRSFTAKVFQTLSPAKQCTATYISWLGSTKARTGRGGKKKEIVKVSFRLRNFLEEHLLFLTTIAAINHVKTVSGHGSSLTLPYTQEA
jgi:hypothetical protein